MGLFLALPRALPDLFSSDSTLSQFANKLFEVVQIVFSSVIEDADIARLESLCRFLLPRIPDVFTDFGNKPKFHYALGHCALMLQRHGPAAFWSSFAFESRLGDLKRACLLVANNTGVAQRGGDLVMEMFALRCNTATRTTGFQMALVDWVCSHASCFSAKLGAETRTLDGLTFSTPVLNVDRFEGQHSAFERGCFLYSMTT